MKCAVSEALCSFFFHKSKYRFARMHTGISCLKLNCIDSSIVVREQISALVKSSPLILCSASLPYTGVTEFEYLAQPISSLRLTICLSLNKQDTLTGRSDLGMQAVSASITAPLSFAAQPLGYLARIPFLGRNSHFFVSLSPIKSLPLLFPTFFLPPFLSRSVHQVMLRWRNPQMIAALALEESIQKCVCGWGWAGGVYVEHF